MKKILLLVFAATLITGFASGQNGKKYYKAGVEFLEGLKYEDAVSQFTSAIGLEPSNPDYYLSRGLAYENLQKYAEAKADFEKAMVFDPKNVEAMIHLGTVNNRTKDFSGATAALNRATALARRNHDAYQQKVIALIGLQKYDQALKASDTAVLIKADAMDYYYRGIIYTRMKNEAIAKTEFERSIKENKTLPEPRLALAELMLNIDPQASMSQCNELIRLNDRNTDAYLMRARVYKKNLDFPNAINDISKNILIDPSNPDFFLERGKLYQEFNQHTNAISDLSKYITMKPDSAGGYFLRAKSYEEILSLDKALEDYNKITALSEFDMRARKMLKEAQVRLYELNREAVAPEISLLSPVPVKDTVEVRGDLTTILVSGKIKEKSKLRKFLINDENVVTVAKNGEYDFLANINLGTTDRIKISVVDDYDNVKNLELPIRRTEINPPDIVLVAPYTSDQGVVFLDTPTPNIAIQGKISDGSLIKSITVGSGQTRYNATYLPSEMNPSFSVSLDVSNLNKFTVIAEDIYGNKRESEFNIDRTGADLAASNPMGRTWVVFIENSSYESFASLDGPVKDASTVQRALANYDIHNIIHKKDMTKKEMEYFFNIELRDLVRKNQVKSLLLWYAGHGKLFNEVSYWIPVDAKRDDEFTYFNINNLKAGLQTYGDGLTHTLVVTDACESGPGFYTAMRAVNEIPTCDDSQAVGKKSAQVFSSAGYELAVDNSKFTATFANTLMNNKNACIPIEAIVQSVNEAVANDKGQKPKFGRIQGMEDMTGTFFFIAK